MIEIVECLVHGIKGGGSYPPSVRAFCISLHSINPRAYNFVREKFGRNIPHPETIRQWFRNSNIDASSGILHHSMDALERKAEQMNENGKQLVVALIMDEMAIKRNMTWCRATNKFIGLVDCGTVNSDDEFTLANNVLMYMVSGLNSYFQQPVAYYFHTTLKAPDRVKIVSHLITEITKRKIKISNLTFDGYTSNAAMSDILGAKLKVRDGNYRTHFPNPSDGSNVYIMYDPSHMEKLVRNILGTHLTFFAGEDKIEWKYFERLVNVGREKNIDQVHKMSKRHLQWKDRKMHVRTAVETLSGSTADAIEYLMKRGNPNFSSAASTVKFIRIYDRLWDVMNTHRIRDDTTNVFKSALNPTNRDDVFKFLQEAKEYILNLEIEHPESGKRIKIINSDYKTGFRGFVIDIISLTAMYAEYVECHHWLLFFATYRISQDHLEMLFGKIRTMNGTNDNPMAHQLISIIRKIIHQCEIIPSPYANVKALAKADAVTLITSNILTVPSTQKRRSTLEDNVIKEDVTDPEETYNDFMDWDPAMGIGLLVDSILDPGVVFVANELERKLLTSKHIYCFTCVNVLNNNTKVDDRVCVNINNGIPCLSTYRLCKLADTAVKSFINSSSNLKEKVYLYVMNNVDWDGIFPIFYDDEHDFEHKIFLVKFFIDEYVNKKCSFIAKQISIESHKRYIRNKLRKIGHYRNQ